MSNLNSSGSNLNAGFIKEWKGYFHREFLNDNSRMKNCLKSMQDFARIREFLQIKI